MFQQSDKHFSFSRYVTSQTENNNNKIAASQNTYIIIFSLVNGIWEPFNVMNNIDFIFLVMYFQRFQIIEEVLKMKKQLKEIELSAL